MKDKLDSSAGFDHFNPRLSIAGGAIQYLDGNDFRYLGQSIMIQALEQASNNTRMNHFQAPLA